ncbi:MAG: pyridoxamine 5'-phosphate oxidase [Gammaproteobacteria bacterium]|jgi:hypothetical protein|nr:pyridoxamine 5'-phosphate oxidase [Gammaproteobacteria bacterium]
MSHVMTKAEREAFLAEPRVGVFSVARAGRPPLSVPIWYAYAPGGEVGLWMEADTPKARALHASGCFSLVTQDGTRPYRYVSVSGPVVAMAPIDWHAELLPLIRRYLTGADADSYIASLGGPAGVADNLFVRMRPAHWRAEVL